MSSSPSPLDILVEVLSSIRTDMRASFALSSLLVYDSVINLDKEIKYFWKRPGQFISWLFLVTRYGAIANAIINITWSSTNANTSFCSRMTWASGILNLLTVLSIDYTLLLRVRALYHQSRVITITLYTLFVVESLVLIVLAIVQNVTDDGYAVTLPGTNISICSSTPELITPLTWLVPSLYGLILMVLAIKQTVLLRRETEGLAGLELINLLIRDQALYFVAVIFVTIFAAINDMLPSDIEALNIIGIVTSSPILSVIGSRLLFHMREVAEKDHDGSLKTRSTRFGEQVSEIKFNGIPVVDTCSSMESTISDV